MFLGRDLAQAKDYSDETASLIDVEVKKIIDTGYKRAEALLNEHMAKLHAVATVLIEKEKIDGDEFSEIMDRKED